ncbi:hypothetical protein B0H13DRAFT_2343513 [Mycena leptocephala]|nr:hypothetical protein B0H13DRAFT_2343513 [Mycena leptocephala]
MDAPITRTLPLHDSHLTYEHGTMRYGPRECGTAVLITPSKRGTGKGKKDSAKRGRSKKKRDGWIWLESLMRGQGQSDEKLAAYKKESDRVQWFRAEAEMYCWLEQYECKHAELFHVIGRYRCNSVVWAGQADHEEGQNGGLNGKVTYGRMQAAMHRRLEHNAKVIFKSAESGAHHDWVSATSFDELVAKIDGWRDVVFKWMDDMEEDKAIDYYHQHDFYARSHLHGVHGVADFFTFNVPKFGLMADWDRVPSLVRIILIVPWENCAVLETSSETPFLQCEFKETARRTHDIFTSVHAAFGTFIPPGTQAHSSGLFAEDPKGWAGSSPLGVSFVIATQLLTIWRGRHEVPRQTWRQPLRSAEAPRAGLAKPRLGANLMDSAHVHVLPEQPFPMVAAGPTPIAVTTSKIPEIGSAGPLTAEMDEELVGNNIALTPWSFHQLNLARFPVLNINATSVESSVKPHLAWMLSDREWKLTKTHENDALALVKDTLNTIFRHATGTSGGPPRQVFALAIKFDLTWSATDMFFRSLRRA